MAPLGIILFVVGIAMAFFMSDKTIYQSLTLHTSGWLSILAGVLMFAYPLIRDHLHRSPIIRHEERVDDERRSQNDRK